MFVLSTGFFQRPVYSIDSGSSVYTSHKYKHNEHIFTVEQGTQFYLKLNLNAYPRPKDADLYMDGHLVPYTPQGTIDCGVDYMEIQHVNHSDAGKYKISSRNRAGEGHFSFRLKVKGTHG